MRALLFLATIFISTLGNAQNKSILESKGLASFNGLFNYHYLASKDKVYLEVIELDSSFLYVSSLSQGVGSNDLFLDRGQIGGTRVVEFRKAGNKLLLIQPNLKYRAITANELERKSIEEAFAKSVIFGFPIVDTTKNGFLIDLTPFLLQDTHGVTAILKQKKQGTYTFDKSRSAMNMDRTKAFPKNVDFDVLVTMIGTPASYEIASVTPDAKFVTVYQHHSFVELPDDKFVMRKYHPNCGGGSSSYMNYSAAINEPMEVKYISRHRLEKKNPNATISEAVEPIIYYLDNGTPEPVRSALLDGAKWWNQAFEAIGYKDAFQVKILPDSIDPLDVRYNVIQWVHRSTRGWSYGGGVFDPRTGEIIKGHVSLGSLRVRQDFLIAKALTDRSYDNASETVNPLLEFALARIRQLAAHEVGHTLGFAHNFAASMNDRASVMDYPHPLVSISNGAIDYSDAYAVGIGEWDKVAVAYAYSDVDGDEALKGILSAASDRGLRYASDRDARSQGSANAYGHLWDNGKDITKELLNVIEVRKLAIRQFDANNVGEDEEYADLEDLFVLLYFYHRYQTEATIKLVGGVEYGYGLRSEIENPTTRVSAEKQREALAAALETIDAHFLLVPKDKLALFPSRGAGRSRESFNNRAGVVFDPLSAASAAAKHSISILLNAERAARLITQKSLDDKQLGLGEVINDLFDKSLNQAHELNYHSEIQESINRVVLSELMKLARNDHALAQIRDVVDSKLLQHLSRLKKTKKRTIYEEGRIRLIEAYFKNPESIQEIDSPNIPDGSPIGSACAHG
ncbi:MAG: hypothetical protein ACI865_002377 [Flavobacteriaceae bacterium]|jgi:hypothetical protein